MTANLLGPACYMLLSTSNMHQMRCPEQALMASHLESRSDLMHTGLQVRVVVQGCETVLGDAAADDELFVTSDILCRSAARPAAEPSSVHVYSSRLPACSALELCIDIVICQAAHYEA